jgi:hypothetical protein
VAQDATRRGYAGASLTDARARGWSYGARIVGRQGSANGPREADVHSAKSRAGRRRKGILELVWQSEVVRLHVSDGSSHRRPAFAHERW